MKLKRLNLHLRCEHIHRLRSLALALSKTKKRGTRLAEAVELALIAGLSLSNAELLQLSRDDEEQPHWLALGPVTRKH